MNMAAKSFQGMRRQSLSLPQDALIKLRDSDGLERLCEVFVADGHSLAGVVRVSQNNMLLGVADRNVSVVLVESVRGL